MQWARCIQNWIYTCVSIRCSVINIKASVESLFSLHLFVIRFHWSSNHNLPKAVYKTFDQKSIVRYSLVNNDASTCKHSLSFMYNPVEYLQRACLNNSAISRALHLYERLIFIYLFIFFTFSDFSVWIKSIFHMETCQSYTNLNRISKIT